MKVGACVLLLISAPLLAQTNLSGSWGGTLGSADKEGTPATLALSVDARGAMTGAITGPKLTKGDVTGTHDAKTGAVSFRVAIAGDEAMTVSFTGTIARDTLVARSSDNGNQQFTLRVVRGRKMPALATTSPGPRQQGSDAAAAARRTFTEVSGWVSRAAAMVPTEKYSYRPHASVRTFGQLVGHVADAYVYYCTRANGKDVEWSDKIEKQTYDKNALTRKLGEAEKLCTEAYASGKIGALIENVGHTNLHYGNMVTYMRMLGLTPPSS